eukprot:1480833-Rhodomonas_salina.1
MGTWGIKLQSTLEKAREKNTLGKVQTRTLASRAEPRGTDCTPRPGTMEYRCLVYRKRVSA